MRKAIIYYNEQPIQIVYFDKFDIVEKSIVLFNGIKTIAVVPNNYLIIFSDEQ